MSSDPRWTGGAANREWQSGTRPLPEHVSDERKRDLVAQVQGYVNDCKAHKAILDSRYHPTVNGVLRLVFHRGNLEKLIIKRALQHFTGTSLSFCDAFTGQCSTGSDLQRRH